MAEATSVTEQTQDVVAAVMAKIEGESAVNERHRNVASAVITSLEAAGFVIVPVEPTPEMERAGDDLMNSAAFSISIWKEMTEARPK